jgi:hypothetical protein
MTSFVPGFMALVAVRLLAHKIVFIETPADSAICERVSPGWTVYVEMAPLVFAGLISVSPALLAPFGVVDPSKSTPGTKAEPSEVIKGLGIVSSTSVLIGAERRSRLASWRIGVGVPLAFVTEKGHEAVAE